MNPVDFALLVLIAFSLPILGIGALIIKWQIDLDAEERRSAESPVKPAE